MELGTFREVGSERRVFRWEAEEALWIPEQKHVEDTEWKLEGEACKGR